MDLIGKFCVFRTYSAGVHTGYIEEMGATPAGMSVLVREARRIWRWEKAFSLNEISLYGVGEDSKISEAVEFNLLTEIIEVIPCTTKAQKNLVKTRNNP